MFTAILLARVSFVSFSSTSPLLYTKIWFARNFLVTTALLWSAILCCVTPEVGYFYGNCLCILSHPSLANIFFTRSRRYKTDELLLFCGECNLGIICLYEVWLTESNVMNCGISDYVLCIYYVRSSTYQGGVMIYCKLTIISNKTEVIN